MYGMLRSLAMAAIFSAMEVAWASDSITQGPAIRKKGALGPKRMLATLKVVVGGMCKRMVAGTDYAGMGGISTLNCEGGAATAARDRDSSGTVWDLFSAAGRGYLFADVIAVISGFADLDGGPAVARVRQRSFGRDQAKGSFSRPRCSSHRQRRRSARVLVGGGFGCGYAGFCCGA